MPYPFTERLNAYFRVSESMFDCETTLFNVKQRQYVVGMRLNMIITHKLGYIYTNYSNKG